MKRKQTKHGNDTATEKPTAAISDSWLPRWAPYVAFGLAAAFLFREFIITKGLLFGTDVAALGYFARYFYAEMVGQGVFPQWDPYVFGGVPFVDAMHGDIFYPTTVLKFVMETHRAMGWKLVLHVFLAGVFTYVWLRHLKISRSVATWGGIAYMLAPVLVTLIYPGHDGKLFVSALTPLALWATDWAVTRGGLLRFATLAIVVSLLIFTAHMQLGYYVTWAMFVLAVYRIVELRRAGSSGVTLASRFAGFAVAGIVGAMLIGAVQLWTPLQYLTKHSQRVAKTIEAEEESAYARATSWSLHPEEAFALVVPEFVGATGIPDRATNTYWGRNVFKLNHEYGGFIPLLLLPFAFFSRRRRGEAWLFTGLAAASLIYALGATTPLFYLFYYLVPGAKLFRAPSSIMFIFAICVITAAALGLDGMEEAEDKSEREEKARKASLYLWGATGVFLLLALLASAGVLTDLWVSLLYRDFSPAKATALEANLANIQRGMWITFLLCGLVAGAWHLYSRGSIARSAWIVLIAILAFLDPLRVDPQYIQVVDTTELYSRDDVTDFLLRQQQATDQPFRVFSVAAGQTLPHNQFAFYGLEELTGHHGNELGRYTELVDLQRNAQQAVRILSLLNVRYLVSPAPIQAPGLVEAFRGRRAMVYELIGVFPRAFLVRSFETAPDSLTLQRILSPDFNPAISAVLETAPEPAPLEDAPGSVRWLERGVNEQLLEVQTSGPALLVVSDNYYPSWNVEIDGQAVQLLRADHTLRAVAVPGGTHQVRFYYRSGLYRAAVWTTLLSTLLVLGIIGASLVQQRRGLVVSEQEPVGA
jgi:hypothetical protein